MSSQGYDMLARPSPSRSRNRRPRISWDCHGGVLASASAVQSLQESKDAPYDPVVCICPISAHIGSKLIVKQREHFKRWLYLWMIYTTCLYKMKLVTYMQDESLEWRRGIEKRNKRKIIKVWGPVKRYMQVLEAKIFPWYSLCTDNLCLWWYSKFFNIWDNRQKIGESIAENARVIWTWHLKVFYLQ